MTELITHWAGPTSSIEGFVYYKDEADKVIAELENRIDDGDKDFEMADHQNERLLKIVRHQKYKRCLAMVEMLEHICPITIRKAKWKGKWHMRWLELAEKFKEAK